MTEHLGLLSKVFEKQFPDADASQRTKWALEVYDEFRMAADLEALERIAKPSNADRSILTKSHRNIALASEEIFQVGMYGSDALRPLADLILSTSPDFANQPWDLQLRTKSLNPHLIVAEHLKMLSKMLMAAKKEIPAGLFDPVNAIAGYGSGTLARRGARAHTTANLVAEIAAKAFEVLEGRPPPKTNEAGKLKGAFAELLVGIFQALGIKAGIDRPGKRALRMRRDREHY